jgi:transposase InsO family protein
MPVILSTVQTTRLRAGWRVRRILKALAIPPSTYYRWLARAPRPALPDRRHNVFEVLPEEREAIVTYALDHPTPRHRELAWRMVDEGVVFVSPSSVYRVLDETGLVQKWKQEYREKLGTWRKAERPDEIWATDFAYFKHGGRTYYLIFFIDEHSRYIVWFDLVTSMDGTTAALALESALSTLPAGVSPPHVRSDNGSGFVSKDFKRVVREWEVGHLRIKPRSPEENPIAERFVSTMRDLLAQGKEPTTVDELKGAMVEVVRYYNVERLHSSLEYLPPAVYYRGDPGPALEERRRRLEWARQRRVSVNLGRRQGRLIAPEVFRGWDHSPSSRESYGSRGSGKSQSA